jgi:tripartite-type tricarboxylate transporter receptor subunit TctC
MVRRTLISYIQIDPLLHIRVGRGRGRSIMLQRRQFLRLAAGVAAPQFLSQAAWAQVWPARPVRIIAGFPAGGGVDLFARLIAPWLSERLGQQFIVENRSGAGGNLGTEAAAKAPPDGYTLLLAYSGDTWNATLYTNLTFNFIRDLEPVASISRGAGVLLLHPAVPARSVPELIDYALHNPGKLTVASGGIGSPPHVFWELFKSMTGVDMLHVPYRGVPPALADLLGGQVQVMFSTMAPAVEHIRAGTVHALAVTGAARTELLPDIPTIGEFVPGYEASQWYGLCAPKGTPPEIIDMLGIEINAGLADGRMKARIAELGDTIFASSRADFGRLILEDTEKWAKVIRATKIEVQ